MQFKNYQIRLHGSILNLDLNLNEIVFDCFTFFVIHRVSFRIGIIGGGQAGTMRNSRKRAKSSYCSQLRNADQTLLNKECALLGVSFFGADLQKRLDVLWRWKRRKRELQKWFLLMKTGRQQDQPYEKGWSMYLTISC